MKIKLYSLVLACVTTTCCVVQAHPLLPGGQLLPATQQLRQGIQQGALRVRQQLQQQLPVQPTYQPPQTQQPFYQPPTVQHPTVQPGSQPQYVPPQQVQPGFQPRPSGQQVQPGQQWPGGQQVQPPTTVLPQAVVQPQAPQVLNNAILRNIDQSAVRLKTLSVQLHDEFHKHFEGIRHAEKLDEDVTALERMADALHAFAIQANGTTQATHTIRANTNALLQQAIRIQRTIGLAEPWLPSHSRQGISHMRNVSSQVVQAAHQIDQFMPVDPQVIDTQTEILEAAIKELHDEFHEHLEGYEVSAALDRDLEDMETLVEHMHEMAHNKTWGQVDLNHLYQDVVKVRQETTHIESLFVQQARIGVRTRDWIGIEHSRDAITDVLASAYLLEHMIRKTTPAAPQVVPVNPPNRPVPRRDRHGHVIQGTTPGLNRHP